MRIRIVIISIFWLTSFISLFGQVGPYVIIDKVEEEQVITDYIEIALKKKRVSGHTQKELTYVPAKTAFDSVENFRFFDYDYHFRFAIENRTSDTVELMFSPPFCEYITLHYRDQTMRAGDFYPADRRPERYLDASIPIVIYPKEHLALSGDFVFMYKSSSGYLDFYIQDLAMAKSDFFSSEYVETTYMFLLFTTGFNFSMFFIFLFVLFNYFQTRDRIYLFYAIYLFSIALYSFIGFETEANISILGNSSQLFFWVKRPTGILINIFYYYFVREFLDLRTHIPKTDKLYLGIMNVLYVSAIAYIIMVNGFGLVNIGGIFYFALRFVLFVPIAILMYVLLKKKLRYGRIILWGTFFLIVGSLISLIMSLTVKSYETLLDIPIIYTQIGIIIEIGFFTLGIAYRNKLREDERLSAKEQLITQLEENERLFSQVNAQLNEKVKYQEALSEKSELFLQKEMADKKAAKLQQQLSELELHSLRSQMNPHFIFNSLNSIKSYILKNGPLEAAEYLTNFSSLMRSILQNSKKDEVSLEVELNTLILYIKLEQRRFPEKFDFSYLQTVNGVLDSNTLPPLILQPYVENAIWHGLLHRDDKGRLIIEVNQRKDTGCILVIIDDNGIGRKAAMEIKKNSKRQYKSMGMGITKSRIDLHNELKAKGIKVEIIDKENNDGSPNGTRVELTISCPQQTESPNS